MASHRKLKNFGTQVLSNYCLTSIEPDTLSNRLLTTQTPDVKHDFESNRRFVSHKALVLVVLVQRVRLGRVEVFRVVKVVRPRRCQ